MPSLVDPDLTKVDLPHLQRDIVKYTAAGALPPEADDWWQSCLPSVKSLMALYQKILQLGIWMIPASYANLVLYQLQQLLLYQRKFFPYTRIKATPVIR